MLEAVRTVKKGGQGYWERVKGGAPWRDTNMNRSMETPKYYKLDENLYSSLFHHCIINVNFVEGAKRDTIVCHIQCYR